MVSPGRYDTDLIKKSTGEKLRYDRRTIQYHCNLQDILYSVICVRSWNRTTAQKLHRILMNLSVSEMHSFISAVPYHLT